MGPPPRGERAPVDLPRHHLLAGAGLAGHQHRDVGGGHLLDAPEDLAHRGARADQVAVLAGGGRLAQRHVLAAQRVEQQAVLHQQGGLRREDRQEVQRPLVEERDHVVVAQVDDAEDLALLLQGGAHHRAELQVDHRGGAGPLGVVERVGHHQRLAGLHHLLDDGVGDPAHRPLDGLAGHVAGGPHRQLPVLQQDEEPLVGLGHLHHRVEELVEEARQVGGGQQPLGEAHQRLPVHPDVHHRPRAAGPLGRRARGRVEEELGGADADAVARAEPAGAPAPPVHGHGRAVVGGGVPVAAVEEEVQRGGRQGRVGHRHVVLRIAAHAGDAARQRHPPLRAVRRLHDQRGHVRTRPSRRPRRRPAGRPGRSRSPPPPRSGGGRPRRRSRRGPRTAPPPRT